MCQRSQAILVKLEPAGGERICLNDVAAHLEKTRVNLFDHRRFCQHQVFVASLGGLTSVIFRAQLVVLYIRPHCAIVN